MMKKLIMTGYLMTLCSLMVQAQYQGRGYPMPGDTLANHTFTDLVNYPKKSVSLNDLKGKWLVLDFWAFSCGSCINSFPKMDKLAKQFKDQVQIIMVGAVKSRYKFSKTVPEVLKITKDLYKHIDEEHHLKVTTAFDSLLYIKADIGSLPHILIIDPNGVIRVKTLQIDSAQLADLVGGKMPKFIRKYSETEPIGRDSYHTKLPLLLSGKQANGGIDSNFLYRSLLVNQTDDMPAYRIVDLDAPRNRASIYVKNGLLEAFQCDKENLYRLAYFGVNHWDTYDQDYYKNNYLPVLLRDSTKLNVTFDDERFSYSLSVPKSKSSASFLMKNMQLDLEKYFGYSATVEQREVPVYYIEIADQKKVNKMLTNDSGKEVNDAESYDYWAVKNMDISKFVIKLSYLILDEWRLPVFNNTGIQGKKISVTIKGNRKDLVEMKASFLKTTGLKIVKGVKKMNVIVINN